MIRRFKIVLYVIPSFLLLLLIPTGRSILKDYRKIHELPTVDNPDIFLAQFNGSSSRPTEIALKCSPFAFLTCINNEYYVSPYWPYLKVKETLVEEGDCELGESTKLYGSDEGYRTLLEDPFWRVFWVVIGNCRLHETVYYGPYRSP